MKLLLLFLIIPGVLTFSCKPFEILHKYQCINIYQIQNNKSFVLN